MRRKKQVSTTLCLIETAGVEFEIRIRGPVYLTRRRDAVASVCVPSCTDDCYVQQC
jgi:hypothetical protein